MRDCPGVSDAECDPLTPQCRRSLRRCPCRPPPSSVSFLAISVSAIASGMTSDRPFKSVLSCMHSFLAAHRALQSCQKPESGVRRAESSPALPLGGPPRLCPHALPEALPSSDCGVPSGSSLSFTFAVTVCPSSLVSRCPSLGGCPGLPAPSCSAPDCGSAPHPPEAELSPCGALPKA